MMILKALHEIKFHYLHTYDNPHPHNHFINEMMLALFHNPEENQFGELHYFFPL